jgi:hypothetical protein
MPSLLCHIFIFAISPAFSLSYVARASGGALGIVAAIVASMPTLHTAWFAGVLAVRVGCAFDALILR